MVEPLSDSMEASPVLLPTLGRVLLKNKVRAKGEEQDTTHNRIGGGAMQR